MKIRVKTTDLSRELALLEKIVGHKPTIAVLGNVLIQSAMGCIVLSATDLEIGLVGACDATVEDPGAVTLPAKKLMELVRAQSHDTIELTSAPKGSVLFTSGGFSSKLQALPASDFPGIPSIDGHPSITLPRAPLRQMIAQVRYAITDKGSKYFTNGAYMGLKSGELLFASTDSARLSVTKIQRDGDEWPEALIPESALDELSALLNESPVTDVTFARSEKHLFFELDGRLMIARMIDGKFPNYARIVPKGNDNLMQVDRLALLSVLKRLVLIHETVSLNFQADALAVTSLSVEVGEGEEEIPADYSGPVLKMKFKGQFLIDFLNAAPSDKVTLAVKDASSALLLTDGDYLNVVMGMQ